MTRRIFHIANAALAIAFWLFYGLKCDGTMHGIEGDSLFLFTGQFACEMLGRDGGLSNWLGAFLTQFYYYPLLGSALMGLLLALLAEGVARFCKSDLTLPLALLPSMACAILLLDPKWTPALPVALCLCVWMAYAVSRIKVLWIKVVCAFAAALFAWFKIIDCQFYTYAVAPVKTYFIVFAATSLICAVSAVIPQKKMKWIPSIATVLLAAVFVMAAPRKVDKLQEEIADYSYMVRMRDWDGILVRAKGGRLSSPLSANAVNLALAMKGRLGEDMFNYYQNGIRSLINFEERKISSEILYLLGFVNEARHLAFEDMAGNPSRDRGVYHLTRLINFNAVDSLRLPIAQRYLNTLHKTLFYRHFEPEQLVCPQMEPSDDFFFNFGDFCQMLGFLYNQRPKNERIRDYFAASLLLEKRTSVFSSFFGESDYCPKSWKEALQITKSLNGEGTAPELQEYVDKYTACHGSAGGMGRFSRTYWYYFNFR